MYLHLFDIFNTMFFHVLQICAEERTDNRVVEFEVAARKLDKKVLITGVHLNYV